MYATLPPGVSRNHLVKCGASPPHFYQQMYAVPLSGMFAF